MPKVSVLIAVYNAVETLNKCMDSLLSQTHTDLDILCVDDASTDDSLRILEHYASQDERIRILQQTENNGAPAARNLALQHAQGELICFLDSDDWLAHDAIESCCRVFDSDPVIDCVLFNVVIYDDEYQVELPYPYSAPHDAISGKEAFRLSLNWQLHGIYMTKAEIHHHIPYDDKCALFSDDNTTHLHYLNSIKVGVCEGTYYYRRHAQSSSRVVSSKRYQHVIAARHLAEQLPLFNVGEDDLRLYETTRWRILIDTYMFHFCHRRHLTVEERKDGLETLKQEWKSIRTQWIDRSLRRKFGYMPIRYSWALFQLQEETYFFLRSLVGRNRC